MLTGNLICAWSRHEQNIKQMYKNPSAYLSIRIFIYEAPPTVASAAAAAAAAAAGCAG